MATLVTLMLVSSFLFPGKYFFRPEYLLLPGLVVLGFPKGGIRPFLTLRREIALICGLALLAALGQVFEALTDANTSLGDAMVLVRYGLYLAALLAGAYCVRSGFHLGRIILPCYGIAAAAILVSYMQYYNIGGINSVIVPLYNSEQYEALIEGSYWRRIMGTLGNANYWGYLLGAVIFFGLVRVTLARQLLWLPAILATVPPIIFTGSRTTVLIVVALSVVWFLFAIVRKDVNRVAGILILGVSAALCALVVIFFLETSYEAEGRFEVGNMKTLDMRVNVWKTGVAASLEDPVKLLFGQGVHNDMALRWGDNIYFKLFRDHGILSLLVYLGLCWVMLRRVWSGLDGGKNHALAGFMMLLLSAAMLFNLTSDLWFNVRITEVLIFLYGYFAVRQEETLFIDGAATNIGRSLPGARPI